MNKIPMTATGYENLQSELKKLLNEDRPNIIAAIAEARSHGDLSENAEYGQFWKNLCQITSSTPVSAALDQGILFL